MKEGNQSDDIGNYPAIELKNIKEELEELRRMLSTGPSRSSRGAQKSYCKMVKEEKKKIL